MTAHSVGPEHDVVSAAWKTYLAASGEQPSIRGLRAVLDEAGRETEAMRQRAEKAEAALGAACNRAEDAEAALAAIVLPQAFPTTTEKA